jgi:hypothetical protein
MAQEFLKSYILLELRLLDGHPVLYTLYDVYFVGEFGGQVQFGCVAGLATQYNQMTFGAGGGRR